MEAILHNSSLKTISIDVTLTLAGPYLLNRDFLRLKKDLM